jgi:hypothetical protein
VTLNQQNRMHPSLSRYMRDIYPHLEDNLSRVASIETPRCFTKSLLWWDHQSPEKAGRSHANVEECKRLVGLTLFLVAQGIPAEKITLLAGYQGQVRELRLELLKEAKLREGSLQLLDERNALVPIVGTIDRYQGDENDIVLVSLTRSNPQKKLGFMKLMNRRCVAQSRARALLIIVGDSTMFAPAPTWSPMIAQLRSLNAIAPTLAINCSRHPSEACTVKDGEDLLKRSNSACSQNCGKPLACRHPCPNKCHGGACPSRCLYRVQLTCSHGHVSNPLCWEREKFVCDRACVNFMPCGHPCPRACHQTCIPDACKLCIAKRLMEEQLAREKEEIDREHALTMLKASLVRLSASHTHDKKTKATLMTLNPDSDADIAMFNTVKDRFEKYVQPEHGSTLIVTKIERVTNHKLEKEWFESAMTMVGPSTTPFQLFHGSPACEKIVNMGFTLPNPSDKNMFGRGIYFATDSSKSAQALYTKDTNQVLLCDVWIGTHCVINGLRTDHPLKEFVYDNSKLPGKKVLRVEDKEVHDAGFDSVYAKRNSR